MNGFVAISRGLWSDPDFRDSEMSQREAWCWMIAHATWKAREVRFGSAVIDLERGQLAYSTRFLAGKFQWSESRVRRYFDMLKNRRMAQIKTDAGVSVITICKYDEFQSVGKSADAAATQDATQERRTTDAKKNQDNQDNQEKTLLPADAGSWSNDVQFVELWTLWKTTEKGAGRSKSPNKLHPIFCRCRRKHGFEKIITGAKAYLRSDDCQKSGGQGLDPWLNGERFLNFCDQPRPPSSPGNGGMSALRELGVVI